MPGVVKVCSAEGIYYLMLFDPTAALWFEEELEDDDVA